MNHQTIEFLARDHIADLRGDTHRPWAEPGDVIEPPPRLRIWTVRLVVWRLALASLMSPRRGRRATPPA
jgi:hypothetical protein